MEKAGDPMEQVNLSPLVSRDYENPTAHLSLEPGQHMHVEKCMALSCVNSLKRLLFTSGTYYGSSVYAPVLSVLFSFLFFKYFFLLFMVDSLSSYNIYVLYVSVTMPSIANVQMKTSIKFRLKKKHLLQFNNFK